MKHIRYSKYRALLSDTLPFETPITFTNKFLFEFLRKNKIGIKGNKLCSDTNTNTNINELIAWINSSSNNNITYYKIPFLFKIKHKTDSFRELTLLHPLSQIRIIEFYDANKELLIYLHSLSKYSIRHIDGIAKSAYFNDSMHVSKLDRDEDVPLELSKNEYEATKSFFTYKTYKNVNKFYESYAYLNAEKKFNNLLRLDVSNCFGSIYTHSIVWATQSKSIAKRCLYGKNKRKSFSNELDKLIQSTNYNETHGIPIGAEFFRIFAEIIFQRIDCELEKDLGQIEDKNYAIFRYVDDYFIFYSNESFKKTICDLLQDHLGNYKLRLSDDKTVIYSRPIITEKTIADRKIKSLLHNLDFDAKAPDQKRIKQLTPSLITDFKVIINETGVAYKDILNYAMSIILGKTIRTLNNAKKLYFTNNAPQNLTENLKIFFIDIIDLSTFLYSMAPRVNLTIIFSKIIESFILFLKKANAFDEYTVDSFRKYIYDRLEDIIIRNKNDKFTPLETIHLLPVIADLGEYYLIPSEGLRSYFGIKKEKNETLSKNNYRKLKYFEIISLLFYIKNFSIYSEIKSELTLYITEYFDSLSNDDLNKADVFMMLFDLITCPYLEDSLKYNIAKKFNMTENLVQYLIKSNVLSFTKWKDFVLSKELDLKKGLEVY